MGVSSRTRFKNMTTDIFTTQKAFILSMCNLSCKSVTRNSKFFTNGNYKFMVLLKQLIGLQTYISQPTNKQKIGAKNW